MTYYSLEGSFIVVRINGELVSRTERFSVSEELGLYGRRPVAFHVRDAWKELHGEPSIISTATDFFTALARAQAAAAS